MSLRMLSLPVLDLPADEKRWPDKTGHDDHGRGPGGGEDRPKGQETGNSDKQLLADLNAWQETSDFEGAKIDKNIREGNPEKSAIVNGIRNETTGGKTIYRGIFVEETDEAMSLKAGDDLQLTPQSFSTSKEVADRFSTGENTGIPGGPGSGMTSVMFQVGGTAEGGGPTHGIVVGDRGNPDFKDDKEVISGGRFKVLGFKDVEGGHGQGRMRVIRLSQKGVY